MVLLSWITVCMVVLWRLDEQEVRNQWLCFKAYFFRPRPTESLREQQSDRWTRPMKPCGGLNLFNCHRKYNLWWLFRQTASPSLQILKIMVFSKMGNLDSDDGHVAENQVGLHHFLSSQATLLVCRLVAFTNHVNHTKVSSANLRWVLGYESTREERFKHTKVCVVL